MPYNIRPQKEDPEPQVSKEEMLKIRLSVRDKLIHDYHSHRLTARLYRNIGRSDLATHPARTGTTRD